MTYLKAKTRRRNYFKLFDYPYIELDNGMKVNLKMYWYMVDLGLIGLFDELFDLF